MKDTLIVEFQVSKNYATFEASSATPTFPLELNFQAEIIEGQRTKVHNLLGFRKLLVLELTFNKPFKSHWRDGFGHESYAINELACLNERTGQALGFAP